ncbi:aminotransferase class I/II-fold pyridoxal phosphate-dependent enzyme [Parabacteroides sp. OttesenSCG-928-G07]|nr:aminotransferase class I/II-fold pyridoxal phosphate-dependent enzyme [Parabacteroides sp. OttesenSCG-928-G21]MDL2278078.1 aminotransferase class I/II-fold pyridoxal phosphate-dependent enzyme [Parabacteroides sp. OttesenSCG-928-G07]
MKKERIHLSLAHMSGNEQKYIQEAFDTNWVVPLGPNVDGFEKDLEQYLQTDKKIVSLSSGTAAIHLGLLLLGVKPGDEVICQSFTFAASANPIKYLGAKPVFVDSEGETWNISSKYLEEAITDRIEKTGRKPKAIIVVHLYGMPAKMHEIKQIAEKYDIPLLEDAAEALGSVYKNQKCGTWGNYSVLSFNGNKIITTSGGGALICPNEASANEAKFYATQARDQAPHYQHSRIGYNYRMSNICAGIGRGQMSILNEHVARRREIHQIYAERLSNYPGITVFQNNDKTVYSNYWLTCILIDPSLAGYDREKLRLAMEDANIEVRPLWKPLHLQPVFEDYPFYGEKTSELLFEKGLCLPSSPILTEKDLDRILSVFEKTMTNK